MTLFKHQGGKARLADRIVAKFPAHTCYCEPFAGAASVLFAKPRSQVEVLNDLNCEIVNTFRCVKLHADAVLQELHLALNSRECFKECKKREDLTDIERAARFLYLKQLSFGGDGLSFGVQKSSGGGANTNLGRMRETVYAAHERLQGVIIEHKDWRDCLRVYDTPATLFYCDPPYIGGVHKCYAAWTPEQFAELVAALKTVKGKWVLSIGDRPEVRKLLRGVKCERFTRPRGIITGKSFAEILAWRF